MGGLSCLMVTRILRIHFRRLQEFGRSSRLERNFPSVVRPMPPLPCTKGTQASSILPKEQRVPF